MRTANLNEGPAKSTFNEEGKRGKLVDSLICEGSILAGGEVFNSVLGRRVFVNSGATVEDSIILDNVRIGEGAKLKRVIVDKNAQIPPGATIGYDPEADRRHHTVSDTGIVIVKGHTSTIPVGTI